MKRHFLHDLFRNILMVVIVLLLTISAAGAATNRGLAVPNETLPAELKGVTVQDTYTGSGTNAVGEIQSVVGHVVVFREDKQYAYFAAPKDKLYERDVVYTLSASRCRFQMYSSDIATMAENTRIMIKTYINNRSTGVKSTSFAMKKGKAIFYALRLFMYKGSSMEVETPTAVTGVRGTKWGVEVVESKESASLPILVADSSDMGAFRQLAQANMGGNGYTIIHSFEGAVFVTSIATGISTTLQGGQSMNIGREGLGNSYPTPPEVSKQFQSDTVAQGGGGSAATSNTTETTDSTGTTGATGSQTPPDTSSVAQQQNIATGTPCIEHWMYSVFNSGDLLGYKVIDGVAYGPSGTPIGPDGAPEGRPIPAIPPSSRTIVGSNAYMEWGYWSSYAYFDPDPPSNGITYYVGNYMATSDSQIAALAAGGVVGTYTGTAIGGHLTPVSLTSGVITQMTGAFNATINFATAAVTNFNINVSGAGGTNAFISGASGTLGYNGEPGTFRVSGGSVGVSGSGSVSRWNAGGKVVGTSGQAVGGDWWIIGDTTRAGGVYQGTR
jgi:hypothetical protein